MKRLGEFVNETQNDIKRVSGKKPQVDPKSENKIKWAVNEPVDDDASDDINSNSDAYTESMEDLIDKFDIEEDFFIIGKAGWGKTSIIKKLAKKYGKEVITVYLDKAEATDLGGIPVPVEGKKSTAKVKNALGKEEEREFAAQIKAMPSWAKLMYDNPDKEFLLFFDEMNQAAPDVMNALMPIVLEHEICEVKFDNFFVGAAGNFEDENGAVNELSGPLKSRFKPLIIWDANSSQAWKQSFKYLHKKWDSVLGEDTVDKFEENAKLFENPREIEMKVFQYMHRIKENGGERNNAEKCLRRLQKLAKEDLTRTEEKDLEKLADVMFSCIAGGSNSSNKKEESNSRRDKKDSNMVPKAIQETVALGMKNGFVNVDMEDEKGNINIVSFGVSKETISEIINPEECSAEMLERTISKCEADGLTWKYEKPQNWSKLGLEDPLSDKWNFIVTGKTKINTDVKKPKKKEYKD